MNFLIVSLGRSGSNFLATHMNKSKSFTVIHDNRQPSGIGKYNNYGEINGLAMDSGFRVIKNWNGKSGVILRNPIDICRSMFENFYNKGILNKFEDYILSPISFDKYFPKTDSTVLRHDIKIIDNLISKGAKPIYFKEMTSSISYLGEIFNYFGINDVSLKNINIKEKINKWNPSEKQMSEEYKNIIADSCKWFIDKYKL